MQDKDTINLLVAQLLNKEDEIYNLRARLDGIQREQTEGLLKLQEKLDQTLDELKSMRRDNKRLANQLTKALEYNRELGVKEAELTAALESLKSTRADELFELANQKRKLYGKTSEKKRYQKQKEDDDLKEDKSDFDGTLPPGAPTQTETAEVPTQETSKQESGAHKPFRMDYSKNATQVTHETIHYCDESKIPGNAKRIGKREWVLYRLDWKVQREVFMLQRIMDETNQISNFYEPAKVGDTRKPYENVLKGHHIDLDMMSQIIVDKYQYSLSLNRVVERLKDAGATFSPSTILNWMHKHIELLTKLDDSMKKATLTNESILFCDETTEKVRVENLVTGKMEYRKKYIWGIKNPAQKIAYYLYDNGSRSKQVAKEFFKEFTGSVTTDGYNVYKMFDEKESKIKRYGCMAHARRKFLDAMQTDARAADFINLISELYWIESDCRIRVLTTQEREKERKERSLPILTEIWQKLEPIYNTIKDKTANLFYKAVRYLVHEWKAISRFTTNGEAEIDNNAAERMMKPICLGRNNYLFCGSEKGAKHLALVLSIIETCKMNAIRPVKYIADVLRKLAKGEMDYTALLPLSN